MKHLIWIALAIFILIILAAAGGYWLGRSSSSVKPDTQTDTSTSTKPLGYIAHVVTPKGTIYILMNKDYIYFNPYESAVNNGTLITLKREDYPKLFKQGIANFSVLQAVEYTDPQSNEMFIKLSNSQPDHGGFASTYVLLVNPFTGEIKEGKDDYSKTE
ncbi:hypothetical protein A2115_03520 [Candidatus Woesebacteria bacterium GWA1_41_8]|uniref:Uncharacterized protein n=1 Tax=Candidatus Woesebacteria bacterium GWA1_41_8 TaxID=1802471 RepID=A0A1F7WIM5_9BACT|nr:MAG: hypothetical protein A2115_03520 [Candidatus Woesebacteria bacterium GWA1_41_8]